MTEIIPAINVNNFEEVKRRIKLIESFSDWVQIDVADGTFTKNTLWHKYSDLVEFETSLNIELHLMINDIEKRVQNWLLPNVRRIIFHIGASVDPDFVIQKCREAGKEVGIAVGPDESLAKAMQYKDKVDLFQILAVHPGLPSQEAQEESFERIKEMRKFCEASPSGGQSCIIEVDGGMNKETGRKAVAAGANIIVAASAIFSAKGGPASGWKELKNALE